MAHVFACLVLSGTRKDEKAEMGGLVGGRLTLGVGAEVSKAHAR